MGLAALVGPSLRFDNRCMVGGLEQVLHELASAIEAPPRDPEELERTLTDGYALVLSLEAERVRIERERGEVERGLSSGDTLGKAQEISRLTARLDVNAGELTQLRGVVAELRRAGASLRSCG
jgi:hypothetical protein